MTMTVFDRAPVAGDAGRVTGRTQQRSSDRTVQGVSRPEKRTVLAEEAERSATRPELARADLSRFLADWLDSAGPGAPASDTRWTLTCGYGFWRTGPTPGKGLSSASASSRSECLARQEQRFERRVPNEPCNVPGVVGVLRTDQVTRPEGPPRAVRDLYFEDPSEHHYPLRLGNCNKTCSGNSPPRGPAARRRRRGGTG
jgi:hypothetical protein